MDCIILAGGLGTRLAPVVSDVPKCMADVNGKPFLEYILDELEAQHAVDNVILALGYKHEKVIDWLKGKAFLFKTTWVIEREQKGTGGAIQLALQKVKSDKVLVINGDTIFDMNYHDFFHSAPAASSVFMALREVVDASRYGRVDTDAEGRVTAFMEKSDERQGGYINGGVYLIDRRLFKDLAIDPPFSFERDILPDLLQQGSVYGKVYSGYFIDIGVPDDYRRFIEDKK